MRPFVPPRQQPQIVTKNKICHLLLLQLLKMDISYYQTAAKAAQRIGKSAIWVRQMCAAGKIKGAHLMDDSFWLVPIFWEPTGKPGRPPPKKSCSGRFSTQEHPSLNSL